MTQGLPQFNRTALHIPHRIAVAWSGGADSTALLLKLVDQGFDVLAWHIDHGWGAHSKDVLTHLAKQAEAWHIPFYHKTLKKPQRNLEAEARQGRYAAFEDLASVTGCYDVALGHHAGDQAETVCMRFLQGAGVAGCQGIKSYRRHQTLHLWRPMLAVSRQDIELFLHHRGVSWLNDPSNQDVSLWRNKVRTKLFPQIMKQGVEPQALFLRWQAQAVKVQQQIESLGNAVCVDKYEQHQQVYCSVNWQSWCEQTKAVRVFLLQKMVGLLFADGRVMGRRHIQAIEQWKEQGGHGWLNLSGCCLYREGQSLQLCQGNTRLRNSSV